MSLAILPLENYIRDEASKPDIFNLRTDKYIIPNDNYVVSRDKFGKILSVYSDDIWDLTPYASNDITTYRIGFKKDIQNDNLVNEFKQLFFLLMVAPKGQSGSSLSMSSLQSLASILYEICKISEQQKITLFKFLSDNSLIKNFIKERCLTNGSHSPMIALLTFLHRTENVLTGIMFHESKENINLLRDVKYKMKLNVKQTEVIPVSILSNSIKQRWEQVNEVYRHKDNLVKLIEGCINSKYYAASKKFMAKEYTHNNECEYWDDVLRELKLITLLKKYKVANKMKLKSFIRKVQGTCYHLILAYSGMRRAEGMSIKTNCLQFVENKKYARIIGVTTKLVGTRKTVSWVTTHELEKVIELLDCLSIALSKKLYFPEGERYLFISSSNLTSKPLKQPKILSSPYLKNDVLPLNEESILITEEHILELEQIEYDRDWRSEDDFQIGKPWHFKTHQYRRTLAVYSIQSGLVSLGALKKQFKHLFREMSYYYQNGSSNAKNIFNVQEKHHISKDLDQLKPELEALSYIKNVLLTNDNVYGVQGHIVKKSKQDKINVMKDREKTIQNFKDGYMSWKETMLGGCIKVEPCESKLTRSLIACIGCECGIHKIGKLESAIQTQSSFVDTLNKNSIEYRTEKADLDKLKQYLNTIQGDKNVND